MALSTLKLIILSLSILCVVAEAQLEWPSSTSTMRFHDEMSGSESEDEYDERWSGEGRALHVKAKHYDISYGALSANRLPCPPRSGRSYYTHNCFRVRAPVNPYTRGCTSITHCRR
ncbi:protein RALF-like 34 [Manihot esculenta]|uniref:Uncharacterized protein n=1 Tax=Manihot esculenta TaxID=3983 RepID=A0ACB7FXG0_MANES|nr:protein RALF-like 34 [Manihot esculenta]KAG8632635.1 hypothetical protein MANES_18G038800v8 [Manihot esculenta]